MEDKCFVPIEFIRANKHLLDEKKSQTTYKIEYVSKYVEKWLFVMSNIDNVENINFIDCMCNAGIYTDGGKGTAIKVLELFNGFALQHPNKTFNLILNDISPDRLCIITTIINDYVGVKAQNINIVTRNLDVNAFLSDEKFFVQYFNCYPKRSANLVFVDPYNFCTVKISVLEKFLSKAYCELIFNIFTSDFVRNQDKEKMKKFCKEENIFCTTKEAMVLQITSQLKVGYIKYSFAYEFKTITNMELYQIMFFTPNIKGLEKLKEALWDTFNGKEFHRNQARQDAEQMSLFSQDDEKDWRIESHSAVAKELLLAHFPNDNEIEYIAIEEFVIENTMLNENQILEHVLKPLIQNGQVKKLGYVNRSSNYKKDKYIVGVVDNED
ncbi:MAG: three-Cys-motif partner protein TcmP [Ruminococcaceae bacterium]|nr:three-Cys-motif partner protein TcmP [Oscillospiraceae bacterium]